MRCWGSYARMGLSAGYWRLGTQERAILDGLGVSLRYADRSYGGKLVLAMPMVRCSCFFQIC